MTALCDFWANQLGGTFLAPGSTLSLAALACTLAVAILCVVPLKRPSRPAVIARALFPRWLWKSASGRADIGYFLFSLLFAGLAFGWALLSAGKMESLITHWLEQCFGRGPRFPVSNLTRLGITIGAFVVYEFAYWLDHFLMHKIPILWQFHATHHSAEHLSLLTNSRVHPVDTFIFYNIVAICLGTFSGIVGWTLAGETQPYAVGGTNALIMLSAVFLTHLQHSQLWVTFGSFWGRWFLSPAHHQIHHSSSREHHDRNFGNSLTIWDALFGTLTKPPAKRPKIIFGVAGLSYNPHSLRGAATGPFADAWRLISRWRNATAQEPDPAVVGVGLPGPGSIIERPAPKQSWGRPPIV